LVLDTEFVKRLASRPRAMSHGTYRSLLRCLAVICLPALVRADNLEHDALRGCAKMSNPAQRLACFDVTVSKLPQVEADRFGMTVDIERKRDPVRVKQEREAMLDGRIAGLSQAPRGELTFTLDNRQVWIEAEPKPNIEFAVGENVHIEHGAMSSLWLVADQHRKVRVKRLR
jgi:hypothetical protein